MKPGAQQATRFEETWLGPKGIIARLAIVNSQPIGKRFILTAFSFFLLGGIMALMMRIQLTLPANDFMHPDLYNQLFTMHGSVMMFLFVVPFLEGLAVYLLPLMIGSRDLSFPRLAAFSYYTFLFGGLLFFLSFAWGAVPDAGWFAYVPLSGPRYSGLGMDFWLLGLGMVEIAGITAGIEIVVTVLKLRAPGMSINRMPVFVWAMLVVGVMIIVAFTTLLLATALLELDRSIGTRFFQPEYGGNTLLWQHLFWFFGHPEVYIAFIPATGIVSMIIPIAARRPIAVYTLVVVALIITGFLSFGLWVHHMYTTGLPTLSMNFFAAASLMIALATGTQIFAWIATLWGSRPRFTVPFLYILGFFFIFTLGGMTGVMVAVVPFDWQVHDTFFVVAHFHYVLIGGVVFPIFAGLYHWFPKLTGRMPANIPGHISFWLAFIGFNVAFFPMHIMGFLGMPRRVYTYIPELGLATLNIISTIGAFMFAAGVVLQVTTYIVSIIRGPRAPDNPWDADTLEWSIASPPPIYAFKKPPLITHRHTLWHTDEADEDPDTARIRDALDGAPEEFRATLMTDAVDARPQAIAWLPGPTYIPFIAATALLIAAFSVLLDLYITAAAGAIAFLGALIAWLTPREDVLELLRSSPTAQQAQLPIFTTGSRSTAWCGLIAFLACCATALAVMFYSYFYLRLFSSEWPQGEIPLPEFLLPGGAFALLIIGAGLQFMGRRAFEQHRKLAAQIWLALGCAAGAAYLALHFLTTLGLSYAPQDNAYASVFFVTTWLFWALAALGLAISIAVQLRLAREAPDQLHRDILPLNLQILAHSWYFTAAAGIAVFAVLYISPHII